MTASRAPFEDLSARYADYLARFATEVGEVKPGAFAKYAGRLIQKMSIEDFTHAFLEHADLMARYRDSLERGDTIDDLVLKLLREQAASLVLPAPRL